MRFILGSLVSLFIGLFGGMTCLRADEPEPSVAAGDRTIRVATFDVDATPPVGFQMAYDPVLRHDALTLRCRGVVIAGSGRPIVLCAVDWIGIGNGSQDVFKSRIAAAAGTTPDRVAVHTLHQHDAPRSDFSAERLLHQVGASDLGAFDGSLARDLLNRLDDAVQDATEGMTRVTHVGFGTAQVEGVASNRRILGDDGTVRTVRYTTTRNASLRAEPVGTIDPQLDCVTFWQDDRPLVSLTYYACHPQSYYRTGVPSPDFPGIARFIRGQDVPDVMHVHFNGAGGNIGAGKYNDGDKRNRMILARRLADGMKRAYEATERVAIDASQLRWTTDQVQLPLAEHLVEAELREGLTGSTAKDYWGSPAKLAWVLRHRAGTKIPIGCLSLADIRVLHLPGELFVEYQLAAKSMRPDLHVTMAAYGDYGPGYIGTAVAYEQGGYETSRPASNVSPKAEKVLMQSIRKLLGAKP